MEDVDEQWELAACALIGDQLDGRKEILGCAIRLRPKGSRLELWVHDTMRSSTVLKIGKQFKKMVEYESNITFSVNNSLPTLF